jgi:hypothetical protein
MKVGERYLWANPGYENIREIIKIDGAIDTKLIQVIGSKNYDGVGQINNFTNEHSFLEGTGKTKYFLLRNQDKPQ